MPEAAGAQSRSSGRRTRQRRECVGGEAAEGAARAGSRRDGITCALGRRVPHSHSDCSAPTTQDGGCAATQRHVREGPAPCLRHGTRMGDGPPLPPPPRGHRPRDVAAPRARQGSALGGCARIAAFLRGARAPRWKRPPAAARPARPRGKGARSRSQTGRSSQPEFPVLDSYQRFPLETAFARGDAPCPSQPCRATGVTAPCAALRTREALRRAAAPPSPEGPQEAAQEVTLPASFGSQVPMEKSSGAHGKLLPAKNTGLFLDLKPTWVRDAALPRVAPAAQPAVPHRWSCRCVQLKPFQPLLAATTRFAFCLLCWVNNLSACTEPRPKMMQDWMQVIPHELMGDNIL